MISLRESLQEVNILKVRKVFLFCFVLIDLVKWKKNVNKLIVYYGKQLIMHSYRNISNFFKFLVKLSNIFVTYFVYWFEFYI